MTDKDTVDANAESIIQTMTYPYLDSKFMPVTRDLSPYRTKALLDYLKQVNTKDKKFGFND